MLQRLHTRIQHVVNQQPLDLDYLEFVCSQEVVLFSALSDQVHIPEAIETALTNLHNLVVQERQNQVPTVSVQVTHGVTGRPRFDISSDTLLHLLNQGLPVPTYWECPLVPSIEEWKSLPSVSEHSTAPVQTQSWTIWYLTLKKRCLMLGIAWLREP